MDRIPEPPLGRIDRVEAWALRAPITTPVVTSFGVMRDRPAVWLRLTGADGCEGWGEVWCNFPNVGAEHRARLVVGTVAPLVLGTAWASPQALFSHLQSRLHVLALQTGEAGPLAQACAGLDVAAWDLCARRAGQPLWRLLGGGDPQVAVYASGLNPHGAAELAQARSRQGHVAFKLKVGFGAETDLRNLGELRAALGPQALLMVDANQAWDLPQALAQCEALAPHGLAWLEEPLAADTAVADWQQLAARCPIPLAGGENLRGEPAFEAMAASRAWRYLQPDLGKWGGFTGCLAVARRAEARGLVYCPHWLGGPIGLVASMHARAAAGRAGMTEWDANPNPLMDRLGALLPSVHEGRVTLAATPGLGFEPPLADLADLVTWQGQARAD